MTTNAGSAAFTKPPKRKRRRSNIANKRPLSNTTKVTYKGGSECYFDGTQKEYTEMEDALKNFRHNKPAAPGQDEVDRSLCQEYFQLVKERFAEMADYVLVEHTGLTFILGVAPLVHVNFRIKHKDENDSTVVCFAELNSATKEKVTCFFKLNIDDDPTAFRRCFYCNHAGELDFVSGGENVYHPPQGGFNGAMDECV